MSLEPSEFSLTHIKREKADNGVVRDKCFSLIASNYPKDIKYKVCKPQEIGTDEGGK